MQTQHIHSARPAKAAFNPHRVAAAAPAARDLPARFRVIKQYEGFRMNQVVYQYTGPTYGIEGPGEVPVTVTPHMGPFIGLTRDYLERVPA